MASFGIKGKEQREEKRDKWEEEKEEEEEEELEHFEIRGDNLYGIRPNSGSLVTIRLDRQRPLHGYTKYLSSG